MATDTNPKSSYCIPTWAIDHLGAELVESIVTNLLSLGAESSSTTAEVHAFIDSVLATLVPEDKRVAKPACTNKRCNGGWIYWHGSEYPCASCNR